MRTIVIAKEKYVTSTERKHLKAFFDSGRTQAKVNKKTYIIQKGTTIENDGWLYDVLILTPYIRESDGERDYEKKLIKVKVYEK